MFYSELLMVFGGEIEKGLIKMKDIVIIMRVYNVWKKKFNEGEDYSKSLKVLVRLLGKGRLDGFCIWDLFDENERRNLLGNYLNELIEK